MIGIRHATSLALSTLTAVSFGAHAGPDCALIDTDAPRLACYDQAAGRGTQAPAAHATAPSAWSATGALASASAAESASSSDASAATAADTSARPLGSGLSKVWELDAEDKRGTFALRQHKGNYLLPVRYSTRPNTMPGSPAAGHGATTGESLQSTEAKFQFSLKFKAFENLLGDNGDLWFAYTQQSHWQSYNGDLSSPFRESVYEPEAIFTLRTDGDVLGWRWRMLNLGFVHQSNGRPLPFSRSWNRVYAEFGLERGNFSLSLRPWLRIPEKNQRDDNPDIRDYMGSGDVRLSWLHGGHALSALGRYSVSGKRGFAQLEWAYPIAGALKGYVQLSRGYGESLIDYNHQQSTIGIGLVFAPWH